VFFWLSKTLDLFLDPWWWMFVPTVVGAVLLLRGQKRSGLGFLASGLTVGWVLSSPVVANRLWASLESDAVSTMRKDIVYEVVVLLGGTVAPFGATRDQVSWGDNVDRLTVTYDLLRTGAAQVAIVSGGSLGPGLPTEAEFLARQLIDWGIAPERVIVESKARNTTENARYSKTIIEERKFASVLMVTSAFHMNRSIQCFRAVGLTPDVLPVDFRMREPVSDGHWFPRSGYLEASASALREYFGRLIYRLSGR
jgi:uncharacterized SAM-binding protein YcdF (DUF218 family)